MKMLGKKTEVIAEIVHLYRVSCDSPLIL